MKADISLSKYSPHKKRNIRAVIFDMDDTLYSCHDLRMNFRKAAWLLIAQTHGLGETQGKEAYHRIRDYLTARKDTGRRIGIFSSIGESVKRNGSLRAFRESIRDGFFNRTTV